MDYDAVEDLSRSYRISVEQLSQTATAVQQIASMMENGALVTQKGQQWVEVLRNGFIPRLNRLMDALDEVSTDLSCAVRELRDGDAEARGRFSS
jgi:hypothetical protein